MSIPRRAVILTLGAVILGCYSPIVTLHSAIPGGEPVDAALLGTWHPVPDDSSSEASAPRGPVVVLTPWDTGGSEYRVRFGSGDDGTVMRGRAEAVEGGYLFEISPAGDLALEPRWARRALIPAHTPYLLRLSGDTLEVTALSPGDVAPDSLAAAGIPWTTVLADGPTSERRVITADSASLRRHMVPAFESLGQVLGRFVRSREDAP